MLNLNYLYRIFQCRPSKSSSALKVPHLQCPSERCLLQEVADTEKCRVLNCHFGRCLLPGLIPHDCCLGPFFPGNHLDPEVGSCLFYSRGISNHSLWIPSALVCKRQYITAVTNVSCQALIFSFLERGGPRVLGRC